MNINTPEPLPTLGLDFLRTFVHIVERGNFTLAEVAMSPTTSAKSMQIRKLEEMLGVDLLWPFSAGSAFRALYNARLGGPPPSAPR
ncbi:LysR family transcriptional regulator (plasmid) [Rhizobium jaguaris]|uniref:LysR family transcriptional regulator n=2 Tax=Rhizobium jaguaris TaxID=1312183 RepID=A0A387G8Y8_9HYPH|nr:LysR family transcriptional regulator [Rhizobium jaguaris]